MPRANATSFYVYYRIAADSMSARKRVFALFADIEARTGIRGTLLARSDDPTTWMETYGPVTRAASFRRLLATLALAHEAATLTPGVYLARLVHGAETRTVRVVRVR